MVQAWRGAGWPPGGHSQECHGIPGACPPQLAHRTVTLQTDAQTPGTGSQACKEAAQLPQAGAHFRAPAFPVSLLSFSLREPRTLFQYKTGPIANKETALVLCKFCPDKTPPIPHQPGRGHAQIYRSQTPAPSQSWSGTSPYAQLPPPNMHTCTRTHTYMHTHTASQETAPAPQKRKMHIFFPMSDGKNPEGQPA